MGYSSQNKPDDRQKAITSIVKTYVRGNRRISHRTRQQLCQHTANVLNYNSSKQMGPHITVDGSDVDQAIDHLQSMKSVKCIDLSSEADVDHRHYSVVNLTR
ncbi:MAG: hypothetical protein L0H36_01370 [bacterium]|nr:hypothetical protein [bacterium]MDN5835266.1 hypothetical protein [bacterium]